MPALDSSATFDRAASPSRHWERRDHAILLHSDEDRRVRKRRFLAAVSGGARENRAQPTARGAPVAAVVPGTSPSPADPCGLGFFAWSEPHIVSSAVLKTTQDPRRLGLRVFSIRWHP